jgi:hypothetical protein
MSVPKAMSSIDELIEMFLTSMVVFSPKRIIVPLPNYFSIMDRQVILTIP